MNVALDERQLADYVRQATKISKQYPVVISKFVTGAREVEVDGVSDGYHVFIGAIIEHVENAGVHSGDATMSIPTISITDVNKERVVEYTRRIATSLKIRGPFNIQFLVKNGDVQVIECNLRSSRSMPFVSKMTGTNLMDMAAKAIVGDSVPDGIGETTGFGVKAPQFSFTRLDKADPVTGVEMVSTGEVACFSETFQGAFINALIASNFYIPKRGDAVLITMGKTRSGIIPYAKMLADNGYRIFATRHTAEEFSLAGISSTMLYKIREKRSPNILDYISSREIKLVINIPSHEKDLESRLVLQDEYVIRRKAAEFGIPIVTNLQLALTLIESLVKYNGPAQERDEDPGARNAPPSPNNESTKGQNEPTLLA